MTEQFPPSRGLVRVETGRTVIHWPAPWRARTASMCTAMCFTSAMQRTIASGPWNSDRLRASDRSARPRWLDNYHGAGHAHRFMELADIFVGALHGEGVAESAILFDISGIEGRDTRGQHDMTGRRRHAGIEGYAVGDEGGVCPFHGIANRDVDHIRIEATFRGLFHRDFDRLAFR